MPFRSFRGPMFGFQFPVYGFLFFTLRALACIRGSLHFRVWILDFGVFLVSLSHSSWIRVFESSLSVESAKSVVKKVVRVICVIRGCKHEFHE